VLREGEPFVHRLTTGQLVGAVQFTPRPPVSTQPPWLAAAVLSGLVRTSPLGLQVMRPQGWQTMELGDWMVWEPGEHGVRVVAGRDWAGLLADREPVGRA